ncbi:MAG: YceD family protein [Bacteroidales bacterium]
MEKLKKYSIPYAELALGKHCFEMQIAGEFFAQFEFSEITDGELTVRIDAERTSDFLRLVLYIQGTVHVQCDRCLDDYEEAIDVSQSVLISECVEEKEAADTSLDFEKEEVIYLSPMEREVDLAHFIYETICLNLPLQRLHYDDENGNSTCNKLMLEKLQSLQPSKEEHSKEIWSKLNQLKK